jgi:diaminopimelate epimerase
VRFAKWHALGNSYVVVERTEAGGSLEPGRVRRLCDVDTGIGSDGVLEVVHRDGTHAEVVVWNPDGTVAEMSGNGVRIAARWLGELTGENEVVVVTGGREVAARLLGSDDAETDVGVVTVGAPEWLDVLGEHVELTPVSVGNPHAVVRRDDATRGDLVRLGPAIETHPRFPHRTNVQLVEPVGPNELRVLVWERGAGETASSGSSATAAAAVAVARDWCVSPVTAHLPGGDLVVTLAGDHATVLGPAAEICRGETTL